MASTGTSLRNAFRAAAASPQTRRLAELTSAPKPAFCPECVCVQSLPATGRQGALSSADARTGLEGVLAWLPEASQIPSHSLVHKQATVNAGAFKHPCLILQGSACGHYVFCAQVTGFGSTGLRGKYCRARPDHDIFWEYAPIDNSGTEKHETLGSLQHTGMPMKKPSWVHFNLGFWIEWRFLQRLDRQLRRLDPVSLSKAASGYAIAEEHRQSLARRAAAPPQWPVLTRQPVAQQTPRPSCWAVQNWRACGPTAGLA